MFRIINSGLTESNINNIYNDVNSSAVALKAEYGLSSRVALRRLHDEIDNVLRLYETKYNEESILFKLRSAFLNRYESPLGWMSISFSLIISVALIIIQSYAAMLCLLAITFLDLYVVVRESNLRRSEIYRKMRSTLDILRLAINVCHNWQICNYPHLYCPFSPCISLQWTYRDGIIVNLPWALLVKGDCIVLKPGHSAPSPCTEINGKRTFQMMEIYGSVHKIESKKAMKPTARTPLPNLLCILNTTPYLENLKLILKYGHQRPPTIYNQQRYMLVSKYIQQWGILLAFCFTISVNLLKKYCFGITTLHEHRSIKGFSENLVDLIESLTSIIIPLLPLVFPLIWISINHWGIAKLHCFLETPMSLLEKDSKTHSFEEDLDTPIFNFDYMTLPRMQIFRHWCRLWQGDSKLLARSANVVQVLGSITALCCVDKKGILSWPNPTAEKVFFLHESYDQQNTNRNDRSDQMSVHMKSNIPDDNINNDIQRNIVAEVLDLTHDQHCPFRLEFDDHDWKNHIKSLKPLGLAILLNTCSSLTHAEYAQFYGHVTAMATWDKDLIPVSNRRCLCELAKQIGFTDHATDCFSLEGLLATYRYLQSECLRHDVRYARQLLMSPKMNVKVPFPHSMSVIMRENPGGYLSLFTQGTADIILDSCDDFWDGKDLRPLSCQDRKKALDFYQRNSLTAYCTAFAYRPLRHDINRPLITADLSGRTVYLELPPELQIRLNADAPLSDFECVSVTKLSHSVSTDSLLFSEGGKINENGDIAKADDYTEIQGHQVFIGMVTMQYQVQTDVVKLIEQLERACIRFVHFSKENELRSRVFSEKMGLESGWNCHISLLRETDENVKISSAQTKIDTNTITVDIPIINQNTKKSSNIDNPSSNKFHNESLNLFTATKKHNQFPAKFYHKITDFMQNKFISIDSSTNSTIINSSIVQSDVSSNTNKYNTCILTQQISDNGLNKYNPKNVVLDEFLPTINFDSIKTLSSSAPGAISNQDYNIFQNNEKQQFETNITGYNKDLIKTCNMSTAESDRRTSEPHGSIIEEHCCSLSILTESTEQSVPVHFDMSNRAKLPRGIENIRPHLEKVDNVPLQVSLFTDCSAEATRQMLEIMQSYGEIVVCFGSSASNSNAMIFLQADCSIGVEPLYPQVCQDIETYSESNLIKEKLKNNESISMKKRDLLQNVLEEIEKNENSTTTSVVNNTPTITPIYLSRQLNSLPCSISVRREDPLSFVSIIELSRHFSSGLWNCIQFWACCAGSVSLINVLSSIFSLPPLLTPLKTIYFMTIPVPLISLALVHIEMDGKIMNRATGKKQTKYDSRVFVFVLWCYGCKFLTPVLVVIFSYAAFMKLPDDISNHGTEFNINDILNFTRIFLTFGILIHFVVISTSFVHRNHSLWRRNPFHNYIWSFTCCAVLIIHTVYFLFESYNNNNIHIQLRTSWHLVFIVMGGTLISLLVSELCKWQEIKMNARYQRRARLDFGTKLGMNSPF